MTVLHGDCLAVLPTLNAESVDAIVCDPLGGALNLGVCSTVAGLAERDEVGEPVGFPVVGEHAIGPNVVNVLATPTAVLACAVVAGASLPPLRLPVRSPVAVGSAEVLRVELAGSVRVTTRPGAELAFASGVSDMARRSQEGGPAALTRHLHFTTLALRYGDMLASGRAGLASAVLESGRADLECGRACLAGRGHRCSHWRNLRQGVGQ